MDLIQTSSRPYQETYSQDCKYYCQVCRFGAPYLELMQYHYAFHCKRYFIPVISQQQQESLSHTSEVLSYDQQESKPFLLPCSDTDCDYSTSTSDIYEASVCSTGPYVTSNVYQAPYDSRVYSQTAFAIALPDLPSTSTTTNYFYSYPSITVPYFYVSAPAGTIVAPDASTSTYVLPTSDTYIEVEQVYEESPGDSASDPYEIRSLESDEWTSYALKCLALTSLFDLELPSSPQDFTYWDADSIEIQRFDPPLPTLVEVAAEENDFYGLFRNI